MAPTDLDSMKMAWATVARYTVYRTEGYASRGTEVKTTLHSNQTYELAVQKVQAAEKQLHMEPGYRPYVMGRALIGIELEKPYETRTAYLALGSSNQGNPTGPITLG